MGGSEALATLGSVVGLIVMMVLIFAAAYYVSKFMGKQYSTQQSSSGELRVIDKLSLGRDHYLLIVEAGEKVLLLGVSPQQIDNLTELDSEAFADAPQVSEGTDFFSLLKNRMMKPGKRE